MFQLRWSSLAKIQKRQKKKKEGLASHKKHIKSDQTFGHVADTSRMLCVLLLILIWAACVAAILLPSFGGRRGLSLNEGQKVSKTIIAEVDFTYVDKEATTRRQTEIAAKEPFVFEVSEAACAECSSLAKDIFKELSVRMQVTENGEKYVPAGNSEAQRYVVSLGEDIVHPLSLIARDPLKLKSFMDRLVSTLYKGIAGEDTASLRSTPNVEIVVRDKNKGLRAPKPLSQIPTPMEAAETLAAAGAADYSPLSRKELQRALNEISFKILRSTLVQDKEATEAAKRRAFLAKENETRKTISKGEPLILRGEKITPEALELLKEHDRALKLTDRSLTDFWADFIYACAVSLFLVLTTGIYFHHIHPEVLRSNQKIGAIGATIAASIGLVLLSERAFDALAIPFSLPTALKVCALPMALPAILVSVLIGLRVAVYSGFIISFVVALRLDDFTVILVGMTVSIVAGFAVHGSKNYKSFFMKTVVAVALSTICVVLCVLLKSSLTMHLASLTACVGLGGGVLTALLALPLLFIMESVFQISTDMSLLTLGDYNHPLLKQLQLEAPGTYHHSLIVAVLAEQAASAIGANPIKARVCALFHDIGKLATPEYFSENNFGGENYHEELRPRMSSLVISNHVKEGVTLAIRYKLGKLIRDAIEQHHGTDLVYYFYRRAIDDNKNDEDGITESEFRYPGPEPAEKEVVLVSLADACEAASRSMVKPSPTKIESLVWEILRKRIREGQLDQADLTFRELALVKESFVKTLTSLLHGRVSYPRDEEDDDEGDLFKTARELAQSGERASKASD